jgi:hypothetical protein
MFAIESGTVEVRANGKQLATLGAGDVFGEVAVLAAGIRMATIVATSPVRLIGLLKRDVWALERRSPETAARLRELIAKRLDFGRACPILFAQMCRSSQQEGTAASAAPSKRHDHPSPGTRSGCRERSRCTARSPGRVRCAVRRSSDSGPGQRGGAHGRPLLRRRAPSPGADAGGRAP